MDPDKTDQDKDKAERGGEPEGEAFQPSWKDGDREPGEPREELLDEEDESQYFERLFAHKKKEDEAKKELVRVALGKFNAFLHLTAYIAVVAYLLILGILYHAALIWVLIVIGLWTVGISYHFYWAFVLKSPPRKKKKQKKPPSKPLGYIPPDEDDDSAEDLDQDDGGDGGK